MTGIKIATGHMLFSLVVSHLSATGHDALSVFVSSGQLFAQLLCMPSTAVNGFRLYVSFCTTIIMPSTSVSDLWLLRLVQPNSLSVRAILRIIFFRGLNSLDFNKIIREDIQKIFRRNH